MGLKSDLEAKVKSIFTSAWEEREGRVVPAPEDIKHSNDAVHFERATVLYADLSGSTALVDTKKWSFAAEIYKTYLYCAAQIIKNQGGVITSYDGDRVMGVFIGNSQSTPAAKCALMLNWTVQHIINPAMKAQYSTDFVVRQVVGIDTSEIRAARTGVRGDNDIVWVGRAANYAAKLTEIKNDTIRTWITEDLYNHLDDSAKFGGNPKQNMWKKFTWTENDNKVVYGSSWWWSIT